jgi:hypothetical protein
MSAALDPLDLLDDITIVEGFAVELAVERVASARAAGATWDDVARRLGVGRQAAHKRFGTGRRGVRLALRSIRDGPRTLMPGRMSSGGRRYAAGGRCVRAPAQQSFANLADDPPLEKATSMKRPAAWGKQPIGVTCSIPTWRRCGERGSAGCPPMARRRVRRGRVLLDDLGVVVVRHGLSPRWRRW